MNIISRMFVKILKTRNKNGVVSFLVYYVQIYFLSFVFYPLQVFWFFGLYYIMKCMFVFFVIVIFFSLNPIFIDRYPIFTSIRISKIKNFEESKEIFQFRSIKRKIWFLNEDI